MQEVEGHGRYEVEIQLGATDESHIIRTIEYWDIERKRYPQYDHTAVIVAEDITSRFFNVIGLFNGFIPVMALQLSAIETADGIGLHFSKVLDTVRLGLVDDDEESAEATDRTYWETKRGTPDTVRLADQILEIAQEFAPLCEQSYNKYYIGFLVNGKPCNFAKCSPQKKGMRMSIALPQSAETDDQLDATDLDVLEYDTRWKTYRLKVKDRDIQQHRDTLRELMKSAYRRRQ